MATKRSSSPLRTPAFKSYALKMDNYKCAIAIMKLGQIVANRYDPRHQAGERSDMLAMVDRIDDNRLEPCDEGYEAMDELLTKCCKLRSRGCFDSDQFEYDSDGEDKCEQLEDAFLKAFRRQKALAERRG